VRGEKTITRLARGFVFLLANPEFYSHLGGGGGRRGKGIKNLHHVVPSFCHDFPKDKMWLAKKKNWALKRVTNPYHQWEELSHKKLSL
jgi:hypothetical protein